MCALKRTISAEDNFTVYYYVTMLLAQILGDLCEVYE